MKVCIFGDSITWGACDYRQGGWATRIRNYFEERGDTPLGSDGSLVYVTAYNLGIPGDTTEGLLARFDAEAGVREAEVVIFAIGINDASERKSDGNPRVTEERFAANIAELAAQAKKRTSKVIFIGLTRVDEAKTNPIPWNLEKSYKNERIERYDNLIRDLCDKEKLLYIDMRGVVAIEEMEDGLHPDTLGHEKMFMKIKAELETYLSFHE
ncbi:MAG TPA: GDSL-type esterase/lipase family protein [Candidatus Paceibacterota bacterium]|nr:GDSL-type esterase/lipase family protein [Candidatus Paceibacterota bacterium]